MHIVILSMQKERLCREQRRKEEKKNTNSKNAKEWQTVVSDISSTKIKKNNSLYRTNYITVKSREKFQYIERERIEKIIKLKKKLKIHEIVWKTGLGCARVTHKSIQIFYQKLTLESNSLAIWSVFRVAAGCIQTNIEPEQQPK